MTDTPLRECWDCGARWPEDVMKKGKDGFHYCPECHWEPDTSKPDCMDLAHARRES